MTTVGTLLVLREPSGKVKIEQADKYVLFSSSLLDTIPVDGTWHGHIKRTRSVEVDVGDLQTSELLEVVDDHGAHYRYHRVGPGSGAALSYLYELT